MLGTLRLTPKEDIDFFILRCKSYVDLSPSYALELWASCTVCRSGENKVMTYTECAVNTDEFRLKYEVRLRLRHITLCSDDSCKWKKYKCTLLWVVFMLHLWSLEPIEIFFTNRNLIRFCKIIITELKVHNLKPTHQYIKCSWTNHQRLLEQTLKFICTGNPTWEMKYYAS